MDISVISMIFTPWRWFMELDSDKDGAKFGGSQQMGDALQTLQQHAMELKEKRQLTPLQKAGKVAAKVLGFVLSPFGSHPPTDYRISRVRSGAQYPGMPATASAQAPTAPPIPSGMPQPHIQTEGAHRSATLSEAVQQVV
jgi:hypothetical protein